MAAVVGTLLNVTISGVTFPVAGDADASHILSRFEKTVLPTSGRSVMQMTKRVPALESLVLLTTPLEAENLRNFANSTEWLNYSFTLADGSSYSSVGTINLENRETATGRTTISMFPEVDWVLFAA
jgi:hypothetical protein